MFIYIDDNKNDLKDKVITSLADQGIAFVNHARKIGEQTMLIPIDRNDPHYKLGGSQ